MTYTFRPALKTEAKPIIGLYSESGCGKTYGAQYIAGQLGKKLATIKLSGLISKYIGETEKNLAQLFARAEHGEVVLLFDEADALFGRRSEVKDSHDRYANIEVSYLLIYGELPTAEQLEKFTTHIQRHTLLHEDLKRFFDGLPHQAHPMSVLSSGVSAISASNTPSMEASGQLRKWDVYLRRSPYAILRRRGLRLH